MKWGKSILGGAAALTIAVVSVVTTTLVGGDNATGAIQQEFNDTIQTARIRYLAPGGEVVGMTDITSPADLETSTFVTEAGDTIANNLITIDTIPEQTIPPTNTKFTGVFRPGKKYTVIVRDNDGLVMYKSKVKFSANNYKCDYKKAWSFLLRFRVTPDVINDSLLADTLMYEQNYTKYYDTLVYRNRTWSTSSNGWCGASTFDTTFVKVFKKNGVSYTPKYSQEFTPDTVGVCP